MANRLCHPEPQPRQAPLLHPRAWLPATEDAGSPLGVRHSREATAGPAPESRWCQVTEFCPTEWDRETCVTSDHTPSDRPAVGFCPFFLPFVMAQ